MAAKPEIILVHGAWADGLAGTKLSSDFRTRAIGVTAAQLPLTTLSDDIAAVERSAARTSGPFVLVSHAVPLPRAPISGVRNARLKSLVSSTR